MPADRPREVTTRLLTAMGSVCCDVHARRTPPFHHRCPCMPDDPPYQPFYCEENIWLLAQDPRCGDGERLVVLITGTEGHVAMWRQKPADGPGEPLLWDYQIGRAHV